jgi:large subunit ribosomal protein L7/L12
MATTEDRIARIRAEAEKALERARKKAAEAAALERLVRSKNAAEDRKKDTRRKILIGSMSLERAATYPDYKERLQTELDKYLTRDDDRGLFELATRPKAEGGEVEKPQ